MTQSQEQVVQALRLMVERGPFFSPSEIVAECGWPGSDEGRTQQINFSLVLADMETNKLVAWDIEPVSAFKQWWVTDAGKALLTA